jgi:hypothetical protein
MGRWWGGDVNGRVKSAETRGGGDRETRDDGVEMHGGGGGETRGGGIGEALIF